MFTSGIPPLPLKLTSSVVSMHNWRNRAVCILLNTFLFNLIISNWFPCLFYLCRCLGTTREQNGMKFAKKTLVLFRLMKLIFLIRRAFYTVLMKIIWLIYQKSHRKWWKIIINWQQLDHTEKSSKQFVKGP